MLIREEGYLKILLNGIAVCIMPYWYRYLNGGALSLSLEEARGVQSDSRTEMC